jgi:hypothetical protein
MALKGQPKYGARLKRNGAAPFAIQQGGGELAHAGLMAHTENTSMARIPLQQVEYSANRTIAPQHVRFFNLCGPLQGCSNNIGGLSGTEERAAQQMIEWLEQWAERLGHQALRLTASIGQRPLVVSSITVAWFRFGMPHKE